VPTVFRGARNLLWGFLTFNPSDPQVGPPGCSQAKPVQLQAQPPENNRRAAPPLVEQVMHDTR